MIKTDGKLYETLILAHNSDSDSKYFFIKKFEPLIKKFAYQLNYYCADTDLVIFFLEFIKSIDVTRFKNGSDGEIVNFIVAALRNKKIDLDRKNKRGKLNVTYVEDNEFIDYLQADMPNMDLDLEWMSILKVLTKQQGLVIQLKYEMGFSDVEIGKFMGITRQAVNKMKNKALEKLRIQLKNIYDF